MAASIFASSGEPDNQRTNQARDPLSETKIKGLYRKAADGA